MTTEIRVDPSDYLGGGNWGGTWVTVPDRLGEEVTSLPSPQAISAKVLAWASCYVTDDIEVSIPDGARCSRDEVVQIQAMLARALVEFDKRNR